VPIDGVIVTAGIPELEEAVALIEELNSVGISHVVFKPGTIDQIKAVIKIAAEVPQTPIIVHTRAVAPVATIPRRTSMTCCWPPIPICVARPTLTICVGGGIGTPNVPPNTCPAAGRPPTTTR
jgi:fatty acid synthase